MNVPAANSYVVFRLGDEQYGLPVSKVSGIIRFEESTPVPRAPEGVTGVINLRGQVIPVVDLKYRFSGTPFSAGPSSRIVVAEGEVGAVGIAVDSANEVAVFDPESIKPVPEGVLSAETARAFLGVVERENSLTIILDLDEAMSRSQRAVAVTAGKEGESDG